MKMTVTTNLPKSVRDICFFFFRCLKGVLLKPTQNWGWFGHMTSHSNDSKICLHHWISRLRCPAVLLREVLHDELTVPFLHLATFHVFFSRLLDLNISENSEMLHHRKDVFKTKRVCNKTNDLNGELLSWMVSRHLFQHIWHQEYRCTGVPNLNLFKRCSQLGIYGMLTHLWYQ